MVKNSLKTGQSATVPEILAVPLFDHSQLTSDITHLLVIGNVHKIMVTY